MICSECLKRTRDKVEIVAKASKGSARHPAIEYVCSRCLAKMLHKASNQAQDESKPKIKG